MGISEYREALNNIGKVILDEKAAFRRSVQRISDSINNINGLAVTYANEVSGIQALGNDPAEEAIKDEFQKLKAQYQSLKSKITAYENAISAVGITI